MCSEFTCDHAMIWKKKHLSLFDIMTLEILERFQFRGPPLLSDMLPARFLAQSSESMQ